jgi:hypothetical protein
VRPLSRRTRSGRLADEDTRLGSCGLRIAAG